MTELRCRGLLFDMDGVIVDSNAVVIRTWEKWAARFGVDAAPMIALAQGRRTSDTLRELQPRFGFNLNDEVRWMDEIEMADFEGVTAIPGVAAFLGSLPPANWAIVTSAGRDVATGRLHHAGIAVPENMITGHDIQRGKPDPQGYLLGAGRLGFKPADCIVFEDAPAGITAGRAGGMRVIGLATNQHVDALLGADVVIPDFTSVRAAELHDGTLRVIA